MSADAQEPPDKTRLAPVVTRERVGGDGES
jgi:hypothetical protein